MKGKIIVTGASSGIGRGVVQRLCAAGHDVHAVARRSDPLAALATETGCTPHAVDVTDFDAVEHLVDQVQPSVVIPPCAVCSLVGLLGGLDLFCKRQEMFTSRVGFIARLLSLRAECVKPVAFRQPFCRGCRCISQRGIAVPPPQVASLRHEPLSGPEL